MGNSLFQGLSGVIARSAAVRACQLQSATWMTARAVHLGLYGAKNLLQMVTSKPLRGKTPKMPLAITTHL